MYKCIKTFAGNIVSMKKGDTIESLDKELAEDYLRAGFIIEEEIKEVETKAEAKVETEVKEVVEKPAAKKPTTTKKKK